jgi:hypothetical protein
MPDRHRYIPANENGKVSNSGSQRLQPARNLLIKCIKSGVPMLTAQR